MELGFFHKDVSYALRVDACDSRGDRIGWIELSYKKLSSLEDVARCLHKRWAHKLWRRERSFGKEYDITAPWPCYEATYYDRYSEEVIVDGSSWSLRDFHEMVHRVCMSPKHVRVRLLKEEDGGRVGDVLGHFSLADHDSYVGMATWLHRLWGRHTGKEVAPGTWISRVADSWPGHRVRMMSRGKEEEEDEEEEEMNEATIDFQDCLLKLQGISIIL